MFYLEALKKVESEKKYLKQGRLAPIKNRILGRVKKEVKKTFLFKVVLFIVAFKKNLIQNLSKNKKK